MHSVARVKNSVGRGSKLFHFMSTWKYTLFFPWNPPNNAKKHDILIFSYLQFIIMIPCNFADLYLVTGSFSLKSFTGGNGGAMTKSIILREEQYSRLSTFPQVSTWVKRCMSFIAFVCKGVKNINFTKSPKEKTTLLFSFFGYIATASCASK